MVCSHVMRNIAGIHPGSFPSTLDIVFLKDVNQSKYAESNVFYRAEVLKV